MPRNPDCTLCPLHESTRHVCVWGHGEGEGFAVGEAPGQAEARTGKPFMGQAGQLVRPIFEEFGIQDPYITNVAKCRPPSNRKPEPSEIKACKPYLLEEIATRKPKAILLLGATAMKAMIGKTGITEMNGQVVEKDGQKYVCCFHPAYILRDPSKEGAMRMAIARYAKVMNNTLDQTMPEWRAIQKENFDAFIADWHLADNFTFDVETGGDEEGTGLMWWLEGFKVYSIAFTFSDCNRTWERTWALSLEAPAVLAFEAAKQLFEYMVETQGDKRCGAHNGKFDNKCLRVIYGVSFRQDEDSLLRHHLVDEESTHRLKPLARQYLAAPDYDLTDKEKKNIHLVPVRRRLSYNSADSAFSDRLIPLFRKKMDKDERWLYERVVMPASRLLEQVELGGLFVDIDYLNRSSDEEKRKLLEVEKELNKMAGRVINWGSRDQVAEVLFKDLGLTPTILTPKGKASTAEEALVDLDHPIGKLLEKRRGHDKFLSTYAGEKGADGEYRGGWREFMAGPHLYLSTKIHGTVTGRYSSRLHQTPRDGTIRNAITAPPGWTFGQLDISQAELRVVAIIAREPEMLRCFKDGIDLHWRTLMTNILGGGGEYVEPARETAKVYCLQHELPPTGTSCEVLSTVLKSCKSSDEGEKLLHEVWEKGYSCRNEEEMRNLLQDICRHGTWSEVLRQKMSPQKYGTEEGRSGRSGIRKSPMAGAQSILERGNIRQRSKETSQEEILRALFKYKELRLSSSRWQSTTQRSIELDHAVQILSSMGPSIAEGLDKNWKEARKKSKSTNFGYAFGQSAQGFITYAKTKFGFEPTLQESESLRNLFFDTYRALSRWHDRQRELARQDGFVRAMSGRKRHLPGIHSSDRQVRAEAERQAINSPVQGFIGDYKAMIMVELAERKDLPYDRFRLKGEVHDSILFWVKNEHIDEVMPIVYNCGSDPKLARECGLEFPISMTVEIELGRWGAGKKWRP